MSGARPAAAGRPAAAPSRRRPPRTAAACAAAATAAVVALSGCVPPQLLTLRSGLDSLRAVVDTMAVRDAAAYRSLEEARREIAEQRDILLSTRATTGSTTQELFDQMTRLEGKLDEVMGRFQQVARATAPPAASPQGDPAQLYDQAAQDLTQGRWSMALAGFREVVRRAPDNDLADNAQYGAGECFFAQSQFDSAAVEYARVPERWPAGDRVPAALYKLALSQERLDRGAEARRTLEDLVRRFPLSGEAQLARERLARTKR
uniref:Tetratricopeptide repeat protein n=1 Tax=Eiseniibacteriota bacterium TaxID=2212470 RepID=A0A832MLQ0_UNCEI